MTFIEEIIKIRWNLQYPLTINSSIVIEKILKGKENGINQGMRYTDTGYIDGVERDLITPIDSTSSPKIITFSNITGMINAFPTLQNQDEVFLFCFPDISNNLSLQMFTSIAHPDLSALPQKLFIGKFNVNKSISYTKKLILECEKLLPPNIVNPEIMFNQFIISEKGLSIT